MMTLVIVVLIVPPRRLFAQARVLAAQLCGDDAKLAAITAIDVLGVLWPAGRECARSFDGSDAVTQQQAAEILGVTRGTVAQLVHRGDLATAAHGGGVLLASASERLLERRERLVSVAGDVGG